MPGRGNSERRARRARPAALFLVLALAAGLVGAAGDGAGAAGTTTRLELSSTGRDACAPAALSAPAGDVTIVFTNPHDRSQSFGVLGVGVGVPEDVREGESSTLQATFSAGSYTFWCGDDADDPDAMRGTLTVTATGGAGPAPPPPAPPSEVRVTLGEYAFSPATLTAAAGTVTVTVVNAGSELHTWTAPGLATVTVLAGETKSVTFSAAPGTYPFFCGVGSHADKGMRGTLTIVGAAGTPPPPAPTPPAPSPPPPGPPPPPPSGPLALVIDEFSFSPAALSATAGTVTVALENRGQLPHTFTVDGLVDVELAAGETRTITFSAAAGSYRFYCGLSGHRGAGMEGTLTVVAAGSPAPPPAPPAPAPQPQPSQPAAPPPSAPGAPGPAGPLLVTVDEFSFTPASLTASAGSVTVTVANRGRLPHTFTIDGLVDAEVAPGQTRTVTFTAAPGSYRFYCAAAGHLAAGMSGTLVVGQAGSPPPDPSTASPPAVAPAPQHGAAHGQASAPAAAPTHVHVHPRTPLPRGCRPRPTVVLRGAFASISAARLALDVQRANRVGRRHVGKRRSVTLHTRTKFVSVGDLRVTTLQRGDRVTVAAGTCRAKKHALLAVSVTVTARPAATESTGTVLTLRADQRGQPRFDKTALTAPAGRVTLRLVNPSPVPHSIAIEGIATGKTVGLNGVSTVTSVLQPGTYRYLCGVTGHAQAGMRGTLVVR